MQIVLTDVLTCPRCGPEFGLIVRADRLEQRRVLEGALGCANCRETYPIRDGVPDLRFPPTQEPPPEEKDAPPPEPEAALRLAAMLGVTQPRALILLAGPAAGLAAELHAVVPDVGVVVAGAGDPPATPGAAGVDRLLIGDRLPLRSGSLLGVALSGGAVRELLDEGIRVLARGARLVLEPAGAETVELLHARGLEVLLAEEGVVVATVGARG